LKIPKKSRKKNPENPKIPGIGIGILKPLKIPKKSRVKNPENPKIPGIGIYFSGISRSGGAQELKPHNIQRSTFTSSKSKDAKINLKIN